MVTVSTTEQWVATPTGKLYSKCWQPEGAIGAPIILLHDSLGSTVQWRAFPEKLAAATQRMVVGYDRLGYGQSAARTDVVTRAYVTSEATEGFWAVLEHYKIDEFVVFGHSVGGCMGISVAAVYGERCRALVTVAAQTFVEEQTLLAIRAAKKALASPEQWQRMVKYHGDKAQWVLDTWVNTWVGNEDMSWDLFAPLRSLTCPVLAIHGKEDEFGSLAHPQSIKEHANIPVTLLLLADVGHVPQRENEASVLAETARFLT